MFKTILVTGSSSGFGYLTVLKLLQEGHCVYATMRDVSGKNAAAAKSLVEAGAKVLPLDVCDEASINTAVTELIDREGALDVLVNNAGVAMAGISESFGVQQVQQMFDVNVFGLIRVMHAVLPTMRQQQAGLIINIGSILGRVTFPFFGLYGASKYAVEAISENYGYELSQLGIDVALIQPSAYPTNMYTSAIQPEYASLASEYGAVADIPVVINDTIAQMFSSETPPQATDVADAVATLVQQERAQRVKRMVVGIPFGADDVNAKVAPIQSALMASLQLSSLETTV